ncbi:hypothetical protein B0T13DRAFT_449991 [Neurospora crassa]|nr:hypothetical protein B0T13DRAFT_449991 [Neurospora crassa]
MDGEIPTGAGDQTLMFGINNERHRCCWYGALLRSWIPPGATGAVIKVQKIEKLERGTRTFSAFQQHSHVGPKIVIVRLCSRTEVTQLSAELGGMDCSAWTKTVPGMVNITATAGERTALAAVEPPTYPLDLMRQTIGFSLRVSLLYGFGEPDRHSWCTIGIAICDVSRSRFMANVAESEQRSSSSGCSRIAKLVRRTAQRPSVFPSSLSSPPVLARAQHTS